MFSFYIIFHTFFSLVAVLEVVKLKRKEKKRYFIPPLQKMIFPRATHFAALSVHATNSFETGVANKYAVITGSIEQSENTHTFALLQVRIFFNY